MPVTPDAGVMVCMPADATQSDADLRHRITDAAIDTFRIGNFHSVRVEDVACMAHVSVDEILRVFPSWDLLVVSVAAKWSGGPRRALVEVAENEGAVPYMRALLVTATKDPAVIRMRMALIAAASDPSHPAAGWYRGQYDRFTQDIALFLTRDIVAKREPRTMTPRHAAEQLIALYEGLQMQSMMMDNADLLASWDRAVTRMRAGWATAYIAS
jgi:AcrR family transcriptional regulator